MILFELDKIIRKNKGALFFGLAILIRLMTLGTESHAVNPYTVENRAAYLSIVNQFSGKITGTVSTDIEKVYQAVANAQVNLNELRQSYLNGEISREEYIQQSRSLEVLASNDDLFLTFYSQFIYARGAPEERYLLYDDGWNALLSQERFDWGFVLLTILFSASIFTREYESNMRTLIIATKKGDQRLVIAKFFCVFVIIILCSLLSATIEYLFFDLKYGLPHGNYPLQSLKYFQESTFQLTLRQTYLCVSAYRMLGLLLLAVVTMFISVLSKKTIVTLVTSLMYVILPYALPVKASTKYLLPSPLGFILAQGFFRGTQMGEMYQADEVLFNAISPTNQIQIVIGWLVLALTLIWIILRRFSPVTPPWRFHPKKTVHILLIIITLAVTPGCHMPTSSSSSLDYKTYNMSTDWGFTVVGREIITLAPYFLIENMETHEVNQVIRDPFSDHEIIDQTIKSVFSKDDKLYYLVRTDDYLEIIELELSTYKSRTIYAEETANPPSLFNTSEPANPGNATMDGGIAFFLTDDEIFIHSGKSLERINRASSSKKTIINNIRSMHVAFDGENIYYTNDIYEVFAYNISNNEQHTIADIRAEYFYLQGNKIYYSNVDENYAVFVHDLITDQSRPVVSDRSFNFVCDDDYLYYINQDDQGFLYRINLQTGISEFIAPFFGYRIQIIDDYPFIYYYAYDYDTGFIETYRIDKKTLSYEKVEEYQYIP